jgi:hypothetical protein
MAPNVAFIRSPLMMSLSRVTSVLRENLLLIAASQILWSSQNTSGMHGCTFKEQASHKLKMCHDRKKKKVISIKTDDGIFAVTFQNIQNRAMRKSI